MIKNKDFDDLQNQIKRLQAENEKLKVENITLRNMMEKTLNECGDAVSVYALDKGFEKEEFYFVNQAWCDAHGYNRIDVMRNTPQALHESIIRKLDAQILSQLKVKDSAYRNIQQIARNGCDYESSERFKLIRGADGIYVACIHRDDSMTGDMKKALFKRTRYEEAVSVSSHILLTEKYSDNALQKILDLLQSVTGVSRVSIFENDNTKDSAKAISEAISASTTHYIQQSDLSVFHYKNTYKRWKNILASDGVIWGNIDTLPKIEQSDMKKRGTASLLVISLQRGNDWYGFISFEDSNPEREWLFEDLSLIMTTAEIIGAYLHYKKTAAEVIKERDLAQLYLNVAGSIIAFLDNEGVIRMINRKGCEVLESPERELIGMNFFEHFVPEKKRNYLFQEFMKIIDIEKNYENIIENTISSAKGNLRIIRWHISCIKNEKGEISGILASGDNITERKLAEEEVKRKEQQFRDMFYEHSAVMLLVSSKNHGKIIDANNAATEYYGYPADDLKNMTFFALHDLRAENLNDVAENYLKGQCNYFVTRCLLKNDEIRDIEIYTSPIQSNNEITLFSIIHDITERVQAEMALKISEERLHLALEATNDGIWDARTDKIYFSPRACILLGKKPELYEPEPIDWLETIHPDDYKRAEAAFVEHVINWTDGYEMEIRIRDDHDNYKWFNIKGKMVETDENGNFKRGVGTLSDISDKKHLENNLRISQQRLELAIQGAGIGLWDYDVKESNLFQPGELYQEAEEEELNEYLVKFYEIQKNIHPDDQPLVIKNMEKHLRGKSQQFQAEFRVRSGALEWRWLLVKGKVVEWDEADKPVRLSGTHIDITERKRMEEQLRMLFNQSNDVIVLHKVGGRFIEVNDATCEKVHYSREELLKLNPMDIFKFHENEDFYSIIEKIYFCKKGLLEFDLMTKYGERIPVEANIHVFEIDGSLAALSVLRDITERKQAELILQRAKENLEIEVAKRTIELVKARDRAERINKLKDEFLAYISHELRTPLSLINLNTELLMKRNILAGKDLEKLVQTENAVNSAVQIIEDIIDISRIEAGEMEVNLHLFYLPPLVEEVISSVKKILDGENRKITSDIEVGQIFSDSKRIRQILINLISNAVKYSEKGNIFVTAKKDNSNIVFSVIDQGKGISPENLEKIFEPFFRESDAKYNKKSMGLGLTICKKIVDNLGGSIYVKTETGKGSCFTFTIPDMNNNANEKVHYFF